MLQEAQLMPTNPRDAIRGQSSLHCAIQYARCGFLLPRWAPDRAVAKGGQGGGAAVPPAKAECPAGFGTVGLSDSDPVGE